MKYKFDVLFRKRIIGLGIDIGNNYLIKNKSKNLFIEITVLLWTFGFEFQWA